MTADELPLHKRITALVVERDAALDEIARLRAENRNMHYALRVALASGLTITVESVVRRALNQSAAASNTP